MKFEIVRASDSSGNKGAPCKWARKNVDGEYTIEISTLEELLALVTEVGSDLIVNEHSIWIYDSYME